MRSPTVKSLTKVFPNLEPKEARLIKKLCRLADSPGNLEELVERDPRLSRTHQYARSCYHSPWTSAMGRRTMILHAIDTLIGTFGVEPLYGSRQEAHGIELPHYYLNTGGSYNTTLIYKRETDNLFIGCWGNIAERF